MAQVEQVLVVPRLVVEEVGMFHGLVFDVDKYLEKLFAADVPSFMLRPEAEKDPTHKQLIPYVLIRCGEKYLTYVRGKRAGETRLVGNRSMGIGGHINPVDNEVPLFGINYREIYNNAVQREVDEEINIDGSRSDRIVALLNDDTNEVGAVHLGVVHVLTVDNENITRNEQMITQLEFMTLEQLRAVRDEMETWSQLCLDGLEKLAAE
ncbi:MAG: NUDIX domain-containing protein [Planctomycetes bacterium]|nr:NUDIX domain-containing protein [Planctomycetota bacterium]